MLAALAFVASFAAAQVRTVRVPELPAAAIAGPMAAAPAPLAAVPFSAVATPRAGAAVQRRLALIMTVAAAAPTGRAILARVAKATGESLQTVGFARLGSDLGRYDYIAGTLTLDRRHMNDDPRLAAVTLSHELLHVAHHAEGVPSEALEMELEAHALGIKMLKELGVPQTRWDGFSREALKRLRRSPEHYRQWVQANVPGKLLLERGNFHELAETLEDELDAREDAPGARAQALARSIKKDARLLRSKAGQARYRRFSARVSSLLRRLSRSL